MKEKEQNTKPDWEGIPNSKLEAITRQWHSNSGFSMNEMEALVGIRPGRSAASMKLREIGRLKREFICRLIAQ